MDINDETLHEDLIHQTNLHPKYPRKSKKKINKSKVIVRTTNDLVPSISQPQSVRLKLYVYLTNCSIRDLSTYMDCNRLKWYRFPSKASFIDFLKIVLPKYFGLRIFGSVVSSIYSSVLPNDIDIIASNRSHREEFFRTLFDIFGHRLRGVINTRYGNNFTAQSYTLEQKFFSLKFDVILQSDIKSFPCDFKQTNLCIGSGGLQIMRRGLHEPQHLNQIKRDLRNKILTICPCQKPCSLARKVELVKRCCKKILSGYTIGDLSYPGKYTIVHEYDKLCALLVKRLPMDIVKMIIEMWGGIGCTYCKRKIDIVEPSRSEPLIRPTVRPTVRPMVRPNDDYQETKTNNQCQCTHGLFKENEYTGNNIFHLDCLGYIMTPKIITRKGRNIAMNSKDRYTDNNVCVDCDEDFI